MPSAQPLPTIDDFVTAANKSLIGERDRYGDKHSGGIYNNAIGPMAILFAREADRDKDSFRAIYLDGADGNDLTTRVQTMWGIPRILDTFGTGSCYFTRTSGAAGNGTFYNGTRITVFGTPAIEYTVASDTTVAGTYATVPIRAVLTGKGSAVNVTGGLQLEDPVYDPLWLPQQLVCSDGTNFEHAKAYVARARALRLNQRNGYLPQITQVCKNAGASYVVAFPSQWGLASTDFVDDYGLNALYVADGNYQSSAALVNACTVALDSARVLGADLWVGGIVQTPITVTETVTLIDAPGKLPLVPIRLAVVKALLSYFQPTAAGYLYKLNAMAGIQQKAHPAVQTVTFTLPSTEPTLSSSMWPANLPRYTLAGRDITITFANPV
jgi:hypothetical protein